MSIDPEDIYQRLLDIGLSNEDIEKRIKAKAEGFQGYMDKDAIIFLVAQDEGIRLRDQQEDLKREEILKDEIDYDEFTQSISDIQEGSINNIILLGRIKEIFPIREFKHKDGTPGMIGNFILKDSTGEIKIVLWGEKVQLMNHQFFRKGEIVRVISGYSKVGYNDRLEIHLAKESKLIISPKEINKNMIPPINHNYEQPEIFNSSESVTIAIEGINLSLKYVNVLGKVLKKFPVKEITKRDGVKIMKGGILFSDRTSQISIDFWGDLLSIYKKIQENTFLFIKNLKVKMNDYYNTLNLIYTKNSSFEILDKDKILRSVLTVDSLKKDESERIIIACIKGKIIKKYNLKEIKKREKITFFLKFLLEDKTGSIHVNVWDIQAVNLFKILQIESSIELSNFKIKKNKFANECEIYLLSYSTFKILNSPL